MEAVKRADLPFTLLSLGVVATLHELSSILYAQGSFQSLAMAPLSAMHFAFSICPHWLTTPCHV